MIANVYLQKKGSFHCDANGPFRNLPEKEKKIIDVKLCCISMNWKLEH